MNPAQELQRAGFNLALTPGGQLLVRPKTLLTDDVRAFVFAHRVQIVASLMPAANDPCTAGNLGNGFAVGATGGARPLPPPAPAKPLEAPPVAQEPATAPTVPPPPPPDIALTARFTWPRSPAMNAAELAQAAQRHARLVETGMTEADADREVDRLLLVDRAGSPPVTAPVPAPPARKVYRCSATDEAWRERDRAYQAHHVQCPACISAGRGYGQRCPDGLALLEHAQC